MDAQYVFLLILLVTVLGVSCEYPPGVFQHGEPHFAGDPLFPNQVPIATLPAYIVKIFHSGQHFPFYRQGLGNGRIRVASYPINYLPNFLHKIKPFGFERYTSYLSQVFRPPKTSI